MTTVIVNRSITALSFLVSLYNSTDPHTTTDLLSLETGLHFLEFYIKEIVLWGRVYLLSFGIIILRSIHVSFKILHKSFVTQNVVTITVS